VNRLLKLLCPSEYVQSVSGIDIQGLLGRGICAVLADLDNTLVPWQGREISPETAEWIAEARRQGLKICIVSNTRSGGRLRSLAETFGVPFVRKGLKPRGAGFREALKLLGEAPSAAAVIGDQIFTDILGGNRLGAYTILVRPLHRREFFGTKMSRLFERVILRLLERRGMFRRDAHARPPREQSPLTDRQTKTEQCLGNERRGDD